MNILVAAATPFEIKPLVDFLHNNGSKLPGISVDIKVTGVGAMLTTYSLCKQLCLKKYDYAFQIGVAGCFTTSTPLGKVYVVKKDTMGDEGVEESKKFLTVFDINLRKSSHSPFKQGWLVNVYAKKNKLTPTANAITVNKISTGKHTVLMLKETFNPTLETMEGAAFHYVCLMEKIPFLQLRATSNYVGDRNKKNWCLQQAIENVNNTLIHQYLLPLIKL